LVSETRKGSKLPFSRFEQLVHRFYDWRDSGRTDINIRTFVGPSFDYDVEALKGVGRLGARRGAQSRRPARSQPGRIEDLQAAGIIGFHTSLAGCGKTHDRWNGRAGDFDY
jgi:hypothetical protein